LAFLDDDDALPPDELPPSGRSGAAQPRPFLVRRLIALVIGVGFIILLVLAFKACLDNRKERSFENYNSDLSAIAAESQQLSEEFFGRLRDPGDLTDLSFKAEVSADRGTAENLYNRVQSLDAPDEVAEAQSELELAYRLRRDGVAGVADQISTALGSEGRQEALERIANYMRYFLASDVLYGRSREDIDATLDAEEISVAEDERLPDATFLPVPPDPPNEWLDPTDLATTLTGVAGDQDCAPGVHGLALFETQINGTALTPDTPSTISGGGPFELSVEAENQGDSEETDVNVEYSLSGADSSEGSGTITRVEPGSTATAKLNIEPDPPTGEELTLKVTVTPVCGEEIADNNTSTYPVTFE